MNEWKVIHKEFKTESKLATECIKENCQQYSKATTDLWRCNTIYTPTILRRDLDPQTKSVYALTWQCSVDSTDCIHTGEVHAFLHCHRVQSIQWLSSNSAKGQLSNHACMNALSVGGRKKGLNTKQLSEHYISQTWHRSHSVVSGDIPWLQGGNFWPLVLR